VNLLTKILLNVNTKRLCNIFTFVGIVEGDVALVGHAKKGERLIFVGDFIIGWYVGRLACFRFDKFDYCHLIYPEFTHF